MIRRYTRPALGEIWSDHARFEAMRQVEVAACEEMDRHLPEILAGIEQQYGDAQRLAWTGRAVIQ